MGWLSATYAMRFLYGGFTKDEETGSMTWSKKKAFKELDTKDPNALYSFPMPDIDLEIAGVKFNPGRDERGRRIYSHFGKQALEIPRYVLEPIDVAFSKGNPLLTSLAKQIIGGSFYKGEIFPARGKFKQGQFLPWDGTRPGTIARQVSRGKEFIGEFIPFSFKGLSDKGIATYIASGFGSIPTRKGLSLKAAEPYIYDALRNKNPRKLKQLVDNLKDGGYEQRQINNRIRLVKTGWLDNNQLDALVRKIEKESKS